MRNLAISLFWMMMVTASASLLQAQTPTGPGEDSPASSQADLSNVQKQIFRDYERFEKSLFDVAEQIRRKDPEQAEVLYRARSKSQEENVLADMELIAELLRSETDVAETKAAQYGPAVDRQTELLARMESILKLLRSLDERQRLAEEMKRIQELLKDTDRLIAGQKDVRAETLRGRDSNQLQGTQQKVADKAKELADKIDRHDEQNKEDGAEGSESENSQNDAAEKDGEQKSSESENSKGEKSDSESSESESSPQGAESSDSESEMKSGEEGQQSDSESGEKEQSGSQESGEKSQEGKQSSEGEKSSEGQQSEQAPQGQQQQQNQQGQESQQSPQGQQSQQQQGQQQQQQSQQQKDQQQQGQQEQQQSQEQTPGREQLEQARDQMQKAIEDLLKDQKDNAVEDQDAAVARLEELKAELEEILRQLREEEKESYLTLLEARFQNMLKKQLQINSETKRLNEIPQEARLQQNYASKTGEIRKEQEDNSIDAEKALNLLREEGSSVAFPEAVQQMHRNMLVIVNRLGSEDTGKTTQLVETLVVETLEEMIAAFQKELKDQEEQQQQQGQPQQGEPQDPSLVNQIAELKMIRSLQLQINRITQQLGTEIDDPTGIDSDQQTLLDDIAMRQKRVQEATYDLSVGRNK